MGHFVFQDLVVWQQAHILVKELFFISELLENRRMYRISSQLSSAALSITNNIAEGAGSNSKLQYVCFLNYSRRSVFECANIILLLADLEIISVEKKLVLIKDLDSCSRLIISMMRKLKQNDKH